MKNRDFQARKKPVLLCTALACAQLVSTAPLRADPLKDQVSQSPSAEGAPNKSTGSEPERTTSSAPTDGSKGSIDASATTEPAKAMSAGVASPMAIGAIAAGLGVAIAAGGGGGGSSGGGKSYSYFDSASGAYLTEYNAQSGLPLINARSLNDYNYTGYGIRLAIVDTGIDAAHQEFTGRTINGTDFAGTAGGATTDLDGHGTHVASIATGARDGVGMRGVAYDATLYSYKIGDDAGTLVGVNTDAKWASVINRHVTDSIKVSNNSWGTNTAITSYTEAQLRSTYPLTIAALQTAVTNGTIFVWAAGNSGLPEVSPEAGLPYRIAGIEDGWLAVVAVDSSGNETAYTNRCGVASSWCVTAPGGGDIQATDGIYAAQSGGTYVRMSGTSMAAPHVSGLLAALAEKFPELTSAQLVTRVKTTASLTGLTSVGGCTTSTCTDAQMRAIFGHGLVNGTAAMARIGSYVYPKTLNVLTGETINLSSQKLLMPAGLSENGKRIFLDRKFKVFDSFDGAVFEVSGTEIFNPHRALAPAIGYVPGTL